MHLDKGLSEKISHMFVGIISDMEKKVINTCEDGTCRTLVAWYAKGGRSNFAAWNGPDRFLMTAVLEEYGDQIEYMKKTGKIKLVDKYICDHQGYGKDNPKPWSHLVIPSDKEVCTTLTTFCGLNKAVIEVYEDDTENSDSE